MKNRTVPRRYRAGHNLGPLPDYRHKGRDVPGKRAPDQGQTKVVPRLPRPSQGGVLLLDEDRGKGGRQRVDGKNDRILWGRVHG